MINSGEFSVSSRSRLSAPAAPSQSGDGFGGGANLFRRVTLDASAGGGDPDVPAPVVMHVANVRGRPYLASADIAQLFPRWRKKDLVRQLLRLKGKADKYETVAATPEEHPELFRQALM